MLCSWAATQVRGALIHLFFLASTPPSVFFRGVSSSSLHLLAWVALRVYEEKSAGCGRLGL
jgi:hypothetical protein